MPEKKEVEFCDMWKTKYAESEAAEKEEKEAKRSKDRKKRGKFYHHAKLSFVD